MPIFGRSKLARVVDNLREKCRRWRIENGGDDLAAGGREEFMMRRSEAKSRK